MLTAQQAQERLKDFQNPHYQQDQLKRVLLLRGKLSYIGQILIQAGPAWNKIDNNWEKITQAQIEVIHQLGSLKPGDLQKIFSALLPRLAPQVEATWKLFDALPYQTTYTRRPFRNPNHYSPGARIAWLQQLLMVTRNYDQEVTWFAAWAPYLMYGADHALGYLFAGAIEAGGKTGQEVFDILIASANGDHEIGIMGRHVVRGLVCARRADGWEYIERMLLAAQREEGLRQVILESVDEAQPALFPRLLRLIVEHNLSRFSAAIGRSMSGSDWRWRPCPRKRSTNCWLACCAISTVHWSVKKRFGKARRRRLITPSGRWLLRMHWQPCRMSLPCAGLRM